MKSRQGNLASFQVMRAERTGLLLMILIKGIQVQIPHGKENCLRRLKMFCLNTQFHGLRHSLYA